MVPRGAFVFRRKDPRTPCDLLGALYGMAENGEMWSTCYGLPTVSSYVHLFCAFPSKGHTKLWQYIGEFSWHFCHDRNAQNLVGRHTHTKKGEWGGGGNGAVKCRVPPLPVNYSLPGMVRPSFVTSGEKKWQLYFRFSAHWYAFSARKYSFKSNCDNEFSKDIFKPKRFCKRFHFERAAAPPWHIRTCAPAQCAL